MVEIWRGGVTEELCIEGEKEEEMVSDLTRRKRERDDLAKDR